MEATVNSLIAIAEDEIKSAKLLYSKGIYHKSLFLFQQATEKAYKASALISGHIGLNDLTKIGHDFIKLLKKGTESMNTEAREKALNLIRNAYKLEKNVTHEDIFSQIYEAKRSDFFNSTEEEIKDHIKSINRFRKASKHIFDKNALLELASVSNKVSHEDQTEFTNHLNGSDSLETIMRIQQVISHMNVFYTLGLLTSPHSEQTRYPFGEGENIKCPTKIYTLDLPLIKHQKKLMNLCGASITDLKVIL